MVKQWCQQTVVIRGRTRHPQSNDCVEQANGTMKRMLQSMMAENQTQEWVKFIPSVQCRFISINKLINMHTCPYDIVL